MRLPRSLLHDVHVLIDDTVILDLVQDDGEANMKLYVTSVKEAVTFATASGVHGLIFRKANGIIVPIVAADVAILVAICPFSSATVANVPPFVRLMDDAIFKGSGVIVWSRTGIAF